MSSSPQDRRISNRVPINLKVSYSHKDNGMSGFSTDISPTGIFIESKDAPSKGSQLGLEFTLPFARERVLIRVKGTVERVVDRNEAGVSFNIPGFGVCFSAFEGNSKEKIKAFVDMRLLKEKMSAPQAPVSTVLKETKTTSPDLIRKKKEEVVTQPLDKKPILKKQPPLKKKDEGISRVKQAEQLYYSSLQAYRAGDLEKALEQMKKSVHFNPTKPSYFNTLKEMEEAYRNQVVLKTCNDVENDLDAGRLEQALDKLTVCYSNVQDDLRIIRLMVRALVEEGKNLKRALELANKAYALDVDDPENYYLFGLVYKKMGNYDKAKTYFQRAVQINDHELAARELLKLLM